MLPPVVLVWEAFQKITLIAPWVASEAGKVFMVGNWTLVWDAIRSTPGASPAHLCSRVGREKYGACVGKRQTKSDQGRKASVENLSTPPSRAGRDASGRKMSLVTFFSLLQMRANNSSLTPLNSILKN